MRKVRWTAEGVPLSFPQLGAPRVGEELELDDVLASAVVAARLAEEVTEPPRATQAPKRARGGEE